MRWLMGTKRRDFAVFPCGFQMRLLAQSICSILMRRISLGRIPVSCATTRKSLICSRRRGVLLCLTEVSSPSRRVRSVAGSIKASLPYAFDILILGTLMMRFHSTALDNMRRKVRRAWLVYCAEHSTVVVTPSFSAVRWKRTASASSGVMREICIPASGVAATSFQPYS